MSNFRRVGIFVISMAIMIAMLAGPKPQVAESAAKGSYSGSWSGSQTTEGMNGRGSGSISFTVDANSGSFSCSFSGSGTFSGTQNIARVNGGVSMSGSGCSGSYTPKTGAVSGSMTINETVSWTYSYTYDGETKTGSDSKSLSFGASVSGNVKKGSGSVSFSNGNLSWKVSGSGGDLFEPVEFSELSAKEKDAALEVMIGDIPPDKLLKMSDKELQAYIDKKFGALDAGEVKGAKGQGGIGNPKAEERVERAAQAAEGKMQVRAAFEPKGDLDAEDITHQKLIKDIIDAEDPYVRAQMADAFVNRVESEIGRLSKISDERKAELQQEIGFVSELKGYVSEKVGNSNAGGAIVDAGKEQFGNYAVEKFEKGIEDLDAAKGIYEKARTGMEIVENINSAKEAFDEFKEISKDLKERREKGDITGTQEGMLKAMHIGGKTLGAIADKLPIAGAGEMVESTFETMAKPALVIATLGKTRDDLVNDPNMNLEGRKMHISEMEDKPNIIERDDPTREGEKIKYMWSEGNNCYMQLKEKKKEPDLYDWAKSLFKKKETPAHLKKYH
jgi:hypothetical protein